MNPHDDPVIHSRKMFLPFLDVFNAAIRWHKADTYDKTALMDDLNKACAKALNDIAEFVIESHMETLPVEQEREDPKP